MQKFINRKDTMEMSESKLQDEIGKRFKFLKEEFGMNPEDAANFISSLLNLGAAMDKIFSEKKKEK